MEIIGQLQFIMKDINQIRQILENQKNYLAEKYSVKEIGIFGSYIHGEQQEEKDIDILVEFSKIPGLFKFMNLENYLSKILDVKVCLFAEDGLKLKINRNILNEVKYI